MKFYPYLSLFLVPFSSFAAAPGAGAPAAAVVPAPAVPALVAPVAVLPVPAAPAVVDAPTLRARFNVERHGDDTTPALMRAFMNCKQLFTPNAAGRAEAIAFMTGLQADFPDRADRVKFRREVAVSIMQLRRAEPQGQAAAAFAPINFGQ